MSASQPDTVVVGILPEKNKAVLWSLVLSAAGIDHWLAYQRPHWLLRVEEKNEEQARLELAAYEEENANWPPADPGDLASLPGAAGHQPPTVIIMSGLALFFAQTGPWTEAGHWFQQGAIIGEQILRHGEWWRVVTALTLHADLAHLLGNVLIGGLPVHLLCRTLGSSAIGWALILTAGAAGNAVNVLLQGPEHNSVGFSTAVFGTIGILVGFECMRKHRLAFKEILKPLGAGAALLAFLGSAGEHTDLGAHFFGFMVGLLLGTAAYLLPFVGERQISRRRRFLLGCICIGVVAGSWLKALGWE